MARVRATNLALGYDGEPVMSALEFELEAGQLVALLAPNAGGKTTLLRALAGELEPLEGELITEGRVAYLPQGENVRLDLPVSALDVATMGTLDALPWWRKPGKRERAQARESLARAGLGDVSSVNFGELSGGQRRRVLLARRLVLPSEIVLLDEPFAGVDRASATVIEQLLRDLRAEGRTVLLATHDVEQARACDRVLCLNKALIAFGPPAEVLDEATLERTYGAQLTRVGGGLAAVHHHH